VSVLRGEVVFVPDEVPRLGRLAVWGDGGDDVLELVFPCSRHGVRKRTVRAGFLTVEEALPALLGTQPDGTGVGGQPRRSGEVWSAAAVAGVGLIARGRLTPTVTASGLDAWRVGPLEEADLSWLDQLAHAFPAAAHALAIPGSRPMRVHSPQWLVRQLWDAIADTLVRTGAATRTVDTPAFAAAEPSPVGHLSGWLRATADFPRAGARLGLRIEAVPTVHGLPEVPDLDPDQDLGPTEDGRPGAGPGPAFRVVLQVRSFADPSLIVDAVQLWCQPERVVAGFGASADADLLLALRRGAGLWPPLGPLLEQARPCELDLTDAALIDLLGPVAEELTEAGIELLWPAELADTGLGLRAVVVPAPGQVTEAGFGLAALLSFQWQLTLDGQVLDAEEVALLAEARRPLVRLRGRWVLVDPVLLERLRQPPRARMAVAQALGAVLAGTAEIDGQQVEVVADAELAALAGRLATLAEAPPDLAAPSGLVATLRPYQQRGLAWLAGMCDLGLGGCLADDMGLGKTIQVIALHLHRRERKAGPTLVICPASVLGTWARELARFAPEVPVRRYHGGERHLQAVAVDEVVLVTYGLVLRDADQLAAVEWGLVVADEAQQAKNPHSHTARQLRAIPAAARLALTGTPVENRLLDLWAILDWTTPGLLGPMESFARRTAVPIERHRDPDATAALSRRVRPFLMRRRKTDPGIAPELPPKTQTDLIVALTTEQVTLYEAVVRETLAAIAGTEGFERAGLVFKLITALKQICNHPEQYLKQRGPVAGRSGKLAAFDELIDLILAADESVLVFTQYKQMATLLQQHLHERAVRSMFLHGGTPVARREEMVSQFQAGQVPVFVLSLKAAGTGLTLTRATHVIHYDRWWNPAVEDQATDRAYRIGQDRPVQVHRMIAEGTLEDRIATLLETKRGLADAVIGSGEAWIGELSDAELADLVTLRSAP
jgi:SNF2-related domain/SNF2 Helicase protein/Helicase conserved C-terminal domain